MKRRDDQRSDHGAQEPPAWPSTPKLRRTDRRKTINSDNTTTNTKNHKSNRKVDRSNSSYASADSRIAPLIALQKSKKSRQSPPRFADKENADSSQDATQPQTTRHGPLGESRTRSQRRTTSDRTSALKPSAAPAHNSKQNTVAAPPRRITEYFPKDRLRDAIDLCSANALRADKKSGEAPDSPPPLPPRGLGTPKKFAIAHPSGTRSSRFAAHANAGGIPPSTRAMAVRDFLDFPLRDSSGYHNSQTQDGRFETSGWNPDEDIWASTRNTCEDDSAAEVQSANMVGEMFGIDDGEEKNEEGWEYAVAEKDDEDQCADGDSGVDNEESERQTQCQHQRQERGRGVAVVSRFFAPRAAAT
ncbi:hypothetical protein HDU83_006269 [Entophlyctis luteolus]|nr:hypothetical protein HDU83_006269 [Entophlyctis luteolus]